MGIILLILMAGTHVIRLGMLSNVAAITMLAPILLALAPKLACTRWHSPC